MNAWPSVSSVWLNAKLEMISEPKSRKRPFPHTTNTTSNTMAAKDQNGGGTDQADPQAEFAKVH